MAGRALRWRGGMVLAGLLGMAAGPLGDPLQGVAGLNAEDHALLARAAERVVVADVPVGSKASWYNQHDNNGGLVTLLSGGACRKARYDVTLATRTSTQSYVATWCRHPDGSWTRR